MKGTHVSPSLPMRAEPHAPHTLFIKQEQANSLLFKA